MNEIKTMLQQMQTIQSRIQDLLDRERMRAADFPDIDISTSEEANTILNNIDILQSALRDMEGVVLTLDCYEEV